MRSMPDDTSTLIELGKRYWLPVYHACELVLDHGKGARVWGTRGTSTSAPVSQ